MLKNIISDSISNEDYRALDGWSSTQIKTVVKHSVQKALIPLPDSDAFRIGRAFHAMMESPDVFKEQYAVFDDTEIVEKIKADRPSISVPSMTKEYKQARKQFESENEGMEFVSKQDFDMFESMRQNALNNSFVQDLMARSKAQYAETSHRMNVSTTEGRQVLVKARPDLILDMGDSNIIIDWKSCRDASPQSFRSDFFRFRYDIQALVYSIVTGIFASDFYFVAIEKEPPYLCAVYGMSNESIEKAWDDLANAVDRIAQYEAGESDGGLAGGITWL